MSQELEAVRSGMPMVRKMLLTSLSDDVVDQVAAMNPCLLNWKFATEPG